MDFRLRGLVRAVLAVALLCACLAPAANAVPAAGITGLTSLVTFDTSTPADVRIRPIPGLQTPGESAIGIDTRPATGELFLVTVPDGSAANAELRNYRVDPLTAVATFVASIPASIVPGAADIATGIDFN